MRGRVDITPYRLVSAEHSHAAAARRSSLARAGEVDALDEGQSPHQTRLMGAMIVPSATGLRTARRISHIFVLDVPAYPRLSFVTDAAVNDRARLGHQSRHRAERHRPGARARDRRSHKVALPVAVETRHAKIPSTVDAAALCKMADRGQITGGVLDGPLAFDNAVSMRRRRSQENRVTRSLVRPTSCSFPTSKPAT